MTMGKSLISDVAESQLITAIKSGDMRGIIFWLKHNKDEYRNRVELSGSIGQVREELTEDEVEILHQALKLAGFEKNIIDEEETQNMKLENLPFLIDAIRHSRTLRQKFARKSHALFFLLYFSEYITSPTAEFPERNV